MAATTLHLQRPMGNSKVKGEGREGAAWQPKFLPSGVLFCLAYGRKGGGYDRRRNERHVMGTVTLRRASLGCSMSGRVLRHG